jgi:hypothetical protein
MVGIFNEAKAQMKTFIQVTANDIKHGVRRDPHACMIALAIERLYPESFPNVTVGIFWGTIEFNDESFYYFKNIKTLVRAFDRRQRVDPFVICLDPDRHRATLAPGLPIIPFQPRNKTCHLT